MDTYSAGLRLEADVSPIPLSEREFRVGVDPSRYTEGYSFREAYEKTLRDRSFVRTTRTLVVDVAWQR